MSQRKIRNSILWKSIVAVLTLMLMTASVFADADDTSADAAAAPSLAAKARAVTDDGYIKLYPPKPAAVLNPFTGLEGYSESAVGKRPVAVVVENDPKARPQWGIDDPDKSPDIIMEDEMEGGETRTLWLWADMNSLPSQVGPTRSARPPLIHFSELFDAIVIHCGLSHSGGDYVGADAIFENEGVDHINMLTYGEHGLFGRDYSRTSMLEHTAFVRGEEVADTIAEFGFRTDVNTSHYTTFTFEGEEEEKEAPAAGNGLAAMARDLTDQHVNPPAPKEPAGKACTTIDLAFSSITPTKHWEYNESDGMYHTQDYYTDVSRKNILLLFDTTHYIVRANTWGSDSETYTDYDLAGGTGKLAKDGRIQDITWSVEDGKIVLKTTDGETAELAPGKIWIGWCSDNHGGWVSAE